MSQTLLQTRAKRAKHDGTRRNFGGVSINDMFVFDSHGMAIGKLSFGMGVLQPIHRILLGQKEKQGKAKT